MYDKKCAWLAHQLDLMGADLVVFQEIFDKEALAHVLSLCATRPDGAPMKIYAPETGQEGRPKVCMATHYEVKSYEWISEIPSEVRAHFNANGAPVVLDGQPIESFSRPVLRARVVLPDLGEVLVFGTHLKSKVPDTLLPKGGDLDNAIGQARSLIRRGVESVGLRCLLLRDLVPQPGDEPTKQLPVILAGDCNGDTGEVTTQILCGDRRGGYTKYLHDAVDLYSARSLHSEFYSSIFEKYYQLLDHMLMSDHFAPGNVHRLADVAYVRLWVDHLVDESLGGGSIPKWMTDHGQLVVTLKPRKQEATG